MRTWDEAERDHACQARQVSLQLAAAMEGLVEAFEGLRNQPEQRLRLMRERVGAVEARVESVQAAAATLLNIADFRVREPDHPGTP